MKQVTQNERCVELAARRVGKAVALLCEASSLLAEAGCVQPYRAMKNASYEAATAIAHAESEVSKEVVP